MVWNVKGTAYKPVTLPRLLIYSASMRLLIKYLFLLWRQEIYGRDTLQPRELQNLGVQVHPSTLIVTYLLLFINIEHPFHAGPSARCCVGHTITETLQRELHYNPLPGPSFLSWARVSAQLPRHWSGVWVRAGSAPGCMLQGPGQLWEPSASSTGRSHFTFPRRCSLRCSSTGPSGDHFSCSWSPDPESSQGTQAQHTQQGTPVPTQHLCPKPQDFAFQNTQQTLHVSSSQTGQEPHHNRERRKENVKPGGIKLKPKKTCLFPEFELLFGILSPWKYFSTKKCDRRAFLPVLKGEGAWINK